jgi:chloride channel protein, CIC family
MSGAPFLDPVYRFVRNQQLILILLAVITGAAASLGAIVFREAVAAGQTVVFGASLEHSSGVIAQLPDWQILLVPTAGGLLIGLLVHFLMPGRRNRGVADVMEAAALRSGSITLREGGSSRGDTGVVCCQKAAAEPVPGGHTAWLWCRLGGGVVL